MRPFSIFALLYITAVVLEMSEDWENPGFTLFFTIVAVATVLTGITRVKFLAFLILTTAYFLVVPFPDVANHVNLIIYCNIMMILAMAYAYVRRGQTVTDGVYFEMISPLLRVSLVLVYFIAGFHKLNEDYFNPEVSCADDIFSRVVSILRATIFGVPVGIALLAVGLFIMYSLVRGGRFGAPRSRVFTLLVVVLFGGLLCGVLTVLLQPYLGVPAGLKSIALVTGVLTLFWELIGSLLLAVPRFQVVMVPFSLAMHSVLAMVGFVDFSALALALLFAFVPTTYYPLLNDPANLRFPGFVVQRAHVYFAIGIVGAVCSGIDAHIHPLAGKVFTGALFNLSVIILIWPILSALFSPSPRPIWRGMPLFDRRAPKFLYIFPVILVLFGMTSYVGLRTAGNFSMFSNLRTEGNGSNHLLLRNNPLKIWGYQEDVVRIIKIDKDAGAVIHHFKQLHREYELPVVEFRKWIYTWTQAGLKVPLTFEYRERIYSTKDVVKDPVWHTGERTWEMVLMDFRAIQPQGPNGCRW